jgi:hypothetical protein
VRSRRRASPTWVGRCLLAARLSAMRADDPDVEAASAQLDLDLRGIIASLPAAPFAFAYGSAVFPQIGTSPGPFPRTATRAPHCVRAAADTC